MEDGEAQFVHDLASHREGHGFDRALLLGGEEFQRIIGSRALWLAPAYSSIQDAHS